MPQILDALLVLHLRCKSYEIFLILPNYFAIILVEKRSFLPAVNYTLIHFGHLYFQFFQIMHYIIYIYINLVLYIYLLYFIFYDVFKNLNVQSE